jgi:SAM-dependent methyltransferase
VARDSIASYDASANALANRYESLSFSQVHSWLLPILANITGSALDVGAGSGRDAEGLSRLGFEVVAMEPSKGMREEGKRRHPNSHIQWIEDALPDLDVINRLGLTFNIILLSAVWMHLPQSARARAFRKLILLLKPGGVLAFTLRHGPGEPDRPMYPTSVDEIEKLARNHGAEVIFRQTSEDELGRSDIHWSHLAIRLADDGTGALPLLRYAILSSEKSSTYKLGLLRTLARIADGSQGMARYIGEDFVSIPLGLVALVWLRLYKPLIRESLPQTPTNHGPKGLGFIGPSFHALGDISALEFRVGSRFSSDISKALHRSLKDTVETIVKMPAHYLTYPGTTDPIFKVNKERSSFSAGALFLDEYYLRSFGEMQVPIHIWRAMVHYDAWIEPALVGEWIRLMKTYADRQKCALDPIAVNRAMEWSDPIRDVSLVRKIALRYMEHGRLFCVWTGKNLTSKNLDVDHCFPWSAWPCDDLWNLLPSDRIVNQKKRDRLPSARVIDEARERIMDWWKSAYTAGDNPVYQERFLVEAAGTLPVDHEGPSIENIFEAMTIKRIALKTDQGIEEWEC